MGVQKLSFEVDSSETDKNGEMIFVPGSYSVKFDVCEGECGSSHEWSALLVDGQISFSITG